MNTERSHRIEPPSLPLWFLRKFLRNDYLEEIEGDLEEIYSDILIDHSKRKARRKYALEVLKLFRPGLVKGLPTLQQLTNIAMLRHNLLISIRNFRKYKSTFLINLLGLSTGLAAFLMIFLWVNDERRVDTFHEKDDQLYWVMANFTINGEVLTWNYTSGKLAGTMMEEFPEVEQAVRVGNHFFRPEGIATYDEDNFEARGLFASENFFDVMSYPFIVGDMGSALEDPKDVLLSESLARKIFGNPNKALDEEIELENSIFKGLFTVKGVYRDPPRNATDQFDFVVNYQLLIDADPWSDHWNGGYARTYLVLKEDTDINEFNSKISDLITEKTESDRFKLFVQKYSENYLNGEYENGVLTGGRIDNVRLFSFIGFFILAIACINFMNLSTAQATRKLKEIGVKKTIGARRNSLVFQFLSESILLSFLAALLALVWIWLFLDQFNAITNKNLFLDLETYLPLVAIVMLITGILAGSYPSFYLSSFKPITVMKGHLSEVRGEAWTRKGLVIVQFTLSILFIIGAIIINRQIEFTQAIPLGYQKENIIKFERKGYDSFNHEAFVSELMTLPSIQSAGNMMGDFLWGNDNGSGFSWTEGDEDRNHLFKSPKIGYEVIETLDLKLTQGRSFSREFNDTPERVILNQSAVEYMGLDNPIGYFLDYGDDEKREVIGVVEDFHYGSLHQAIEPMIIRFRERGNDYLVRVQPGSEAVALKQIEDIYKKFNPRYSFEPSFLEDDYQAQYSTEERIATLSKYMAGIAIIISCLGLFGLAAFTAERKTKEIGVRKILGATQLNIIKILSSSFSMSFLVALLIAIPLGYYFASEWLSKFAYSIDITLWIFIMAGFISLIIAGLTITMQTFKAARTNPTEFLRNE